RGAGLRDYGPGTGGGGPAVVFIPSLINPPYVLDLAAQNSLLRWLAARGHRVLLLDWGEDVAARGELSIAGHVEEIMLPLLAGHEGAALAGYCLGGTMALAAAGHLRCRAVATIAAPWHFSGYEDAARGEVARLWQAARPAAETLGLLPMEILQSGFWALDPARTVRKYARFAELEPESEAARAFIALEDWANEGPPLPAAAARELFETLFGGDLPGRGAWRIAGGTADPARLACAQLHLVATGDRIVPAASAPRTGERLETDAGHVGMVVGSRARKQLWEPLDTWLQALCD
ncbi:MAG: alpha/beta fold hydrolase, partial [Sphingomonadaceae bacterium]